jgi:choline kinase
MPKCLLPVGGQPILERALQSVFSAGFTRCTIVAGYYCEMIRSYIRRDFPHWDIHFVLNDKFEATGTAYSLLCARQAVGTDDFLLLDGDLVFDDGILELLLHSPHANVIAYSIHGEIHDATLKICLNDHDVVEHIGNDAQCPPIAGRLIGMQKLAGELAPALFDALDRRVHASHLLKDPYSAVLDELIANGALIHGADIGVMQCLEIDTLTDLQAADVHFAAAQAAS